ncbi:hypothetical protein LJC47_01550 [Desulfosarcina sp. OttesenSCG-928-B08]|nr:hypothetical protein [Desulfosarcina sp. OttesenSCG-928-B08]
MRIPTQSLIPASKTPMPNNQETAGKKTAEDQNRPIPFRCFLNSVFCFLHPQQFLPEFVHRLASGGQTGQLGQFVEIRADRHEVFDWLWNVAEPGFEKRQNTFNFSFCNTGSGLPFFLYSSIPQQR